MNERILAAQEFVMAFNAVSMFRSREAALTDSRVQAARRRYCQARNADGHRLALAA